MRSLIRRGLSGRKAEEAVGQLFGVVRSALQKYNSPDRRAMFGAVDDDEALAHTALSRHWDAFVRRNWWGLDAAAKNALRPMVRRLIEEAPPI